MIITNAHHDIIAIGQYKVIKKLDESKIGVLYLTKDIKPPYKEYLVQLSKTTKKYKVYEA